MIEKQCEENKVLSITYDHFDFDIEKIEEVTITHHLRSIIRLALIGLLANLHATPTAIEKFTKRDREILVRLSKEHLSDIEEHEVQSAIEALKSISEKVREFLDTWFPIIEPGMKIFLKKIAGVDYEGDLAASVPTTEKPAQLRFQLQALVRLLKAIGYKSIFVLVDRVDETSLTGNDAKASFRLVEPILRDLELLETKGVGFKFFLWDQLEPYYSETGRTDRIRHETLEWDDEMLVSMLKKRLQTFSQGKITTLRDICSPTSPFSADQLALIFANASPRDLIRIGAQYLAEQIEVDPFANKVSSEAIYRALEKFCNRRASEVISSGTLHDLMGIQQVDFTISYLANDVYKEKQNSTRNRIRSWRKEGAIVDVEFIENPSPDQERSVKLIAVLDVRVAKAMHPELSIPNFLKTKYKKCSRCGTAVLRDWQDKDSSSKCHACQYDLLTKEEKDPFQDWQRKEFASQSRRRQRREVSQYIQGQLFHGINEDIDDANVD
jgi:hypothetical protein